MQRSELKEIIEAACDAAGVVGNDRRRLVNSADLTDRIAVGTFRVKSPGASCGCPATVAGFYVAGENGVGGTWTTQNSAILNFPGEFDSRASARAEDIVQTDTGAFIPVTD